MQTTLTPIQECQRHIDQLEEELRRIPATDYNRRKIADREESLQRYRRMIRMLAERN